MYLSGIQQTQSIIYNQQSNQNKQPLNSQNEQKTWQLVYTAFNKFDANKTGQLDSKQLQNFLTFALNNGLIQHNNQNVRQIVYEMTKKMDKNHDGLVSKRQLFQYLNNKNNCRISKIQSKVYIQQKNNKQQSLMFAKKSGKHYTQQQIVKLTNDLFNKYDANGTGQLDYYQMKGLLQNQLNQYSYRQFKEIADTDHSGLISKSQLYEFLKYKLLNK